MGEEKRILTPIIAARDATSRIQCLSFFPPSLQLNLYIITHGQQRPPNDHFFSYLMVIYKVLIAHSDGGFQQRPTRLSRGHFELAERTQTL